jgi:predicted nuclease with TOPRIM domain
MDTPEKSDPMPELTAKLKMCDPEIQKFITALKTENLKLQKKIAKLQGENVTLNNRIKILEEEEFKPKLNIVLEQYSDHDTSKEKE